MTGNHPGSQIKSVADLLAHAYQMELEAEERYNHLAEQMEVHNNFELAKLFRKLADVERIHASEIRQQMQEMKLPQSSLVADGWAGDEPPESIDMGNVSYLTTPRQALQLALEAECHAQQFFDHLGATTQDRGVSRLAAEFAEEEREHVDLVLAELEKYSASEDAPCDDMDPPVAQG